MWPHFSHLVAVFYMAPTLLCAQTTGTSALIAVRSAMFWEQPFPCLP